MTEIIYLDDEALRKGDFFVLEERIESEGKIFGLGERIGRGGNGAVFRCYDEGTADEYAIKFLMTGGFAPTRRFFREVQLLKELQTEHAITFRGSGRLKVSGKPKKQRTIPFVIMDLAETDLFNHIKRQKQLVPPEIYLGQFHGLATALSELHNIAVHRDIKPENILVNGDRWLLSDYGLCSYVRGNAEDLTGVQQSIGPKYWMSPEGHNKRIGCGDKIGAAADVYQLAAVFWWIATGRHPSGVLERSDWRGPENLFMPIYRALSHDPSRRPANGREFLNEIEVCLPS